MGDRPGELPGTRVVPVGTRQDTSFPAYFRGPLENYFDSYVSRAAFIETRKIIDKPATLARRAPPVQSFGATTNPRHRS
jgi:hypothetical protein